MATVDETTSNDLDKVMHLLREYTPKLRKLCEQEQLRRFRLFQMMAIFTACLATLMATIVILLPKYAGSDTIGAPVAVIIGGTAAIAAVFFSLYAGPTSLRYRNSFDAQLVASTVRRLVQLASQYFEHSSLRIGDQFEFELRLAEAEASLEFYYRVFQRDQHSTGGRNPRQQELTDAETQQLRQRISDGDSDIYTLAKEFGCSASQVARIKAAMNR